MVKMTPDERIAELETKVEKYESFFKDLSKKYEECTEGLNFEKEDLLQAQALLSLATLGMVDSEMIALALASARLRERLKD